MALGDYDLAGPLARARRVLQDTPEPGWDAIENRVIAAVRNTPRGGWPLTVVDPEPGARGTIAVTDRALRASVARALGADPDFAVGAIDVSAQGMAVVGVRIELTGRYGVDLNVTAERALRMCARALDVAIGDAAGIAIEVVVTDVHR